MKYGGVVSEVKPAICGKRFVMRQRNRQKTCACVCVCLCACVGVGGGGLRHRVEGVDTEADKRQ